MTVAENENDAGKGYCPSCERTYDSSDRCPRDGRQLVRLGPVIDPMIGRTLDDRYTIMERIGQGGMGTVYRGEQHAFDREVAIKVIGSRFLVETDAIKRFVREARLASRLSHPNAVSVLDFGQTDDGLFYLVMELVAGRTLELVMKTEHILPPGRVVRIGTQICDALEVAHGLQIVHRDLKPANIMLASEGRDLIKVLDFGLAKSFAPEHSGMSVTTTGVMIGTPAYMPPEVASGALCDGRSDLYSLGCVLYVLASGRLPFVADSPHQLVAMHRHERPPPIDGVPTALAAIIDQMLEKDPALRPASAAEARQALEAALESTSTPAAEPLGPTIMVTSARARPRRSRRWVVPLVAVIVLGAGAGVYTAVRASGSAAGQSPAATQVQVQPPPSPAPVHSAPAVAPPPPTVPPEAPRQSPPPQNRPRTPPASADKPAPPPKPPVSSDSSPDLPF